MAITEITAQAPARREGGLLFSFIVLSSIVLKGSSVFGEKWKLLHDSKRPQQANCSNFHHLWFDVKNFTPLYLKSERYQPAFVAGLLSLKRTVDIGEICEPSAEYMQRKQCAAVSAGSRY
jgi:hypothetical protein